MTQRRGRRQRSAMLEQLFRVFLSRRVDPGRRELERS